MVVLRDKRWLGHVSRGERGQVSLTPYVDNTKQDYGTITRSAERESAKKSKPGS